MVVTFRNLDLRTVLVLVLKDRPALLGVMSVLSEEAPVVLGVGQPRLLPGSARADVLLQACGSTARASAACAYVLMPAGMS